MAIVYTLAMIYSFTTGLALRKIIKTIPENVKIESINAQTGIVRIITQTGAIEYVISDPAFKKLRPQGMYFRPSQRAIAARKLRIAESLCGHEGLLFRHASSNRAVVDIGGQTVQLRSFVSKITN